MIQEVIQPLAQPSINAFEVSEACRALSVSRSGFYAHLDKDQRVRRRQDRVLTELIKKVFDENQGVYGSVRLVRGLRERGVRTSKTRVRRLMKSEKICPRQKRRIRIHTTKSNPHLPVAPHLLLEAPPAQKPGERFYSDITTIPTHEGWLFTAATLDAYSRRCAGWSAADNMETPLVLRAAKRALAAVDATGCIHHSDRGSQYASELFRNFLEEQGIDQSMSRKANCYDKAAMESFWATLKTECFDNFRNGIPATRHEAKQKLFDYIEVFYNRKRLHSSLGYCSHVKFEVKHQQQNLKKEGKLFL